MLRLPVLLAGLLVWLAASTGLAQDAQEQPPAESSSDAQRADLAAAIAAYEAGDFARARELFERVHAVAPTARTLRSLALVAYKQRRLAEALTLFDDSLNSQVKPLSADMREDVEGLIKTVRAELARETEPAQPELIAPPVAQPTSAHPDAAPATPAAPPKTLSTRTRRLRRTGYALLGVAGAALLGGAAALLTGALRRNDIEAACRENSDHKCSPEAVDKAEHAARLDLLGALAATGFALAGASAAAAATTLTLSYRPARGSERHVPVVALTFRTAF